MTKDEALRLALEALETSMYPQQKQLQAITAIKATLEAKDEPVAYTTGHCKEKAKPSGCQLHNLHCGYPSCDRKAVTTPPQRKPLTDETRNWIVATCPTPRHIIDAVERMHGIKGEA